MCSNPQTRKAGYYENFCLFQDTIRCSLSDIETGWDWDNDGYEHTSYFSNVAFVLRDIRAPGGLLDIYAVRFCFDTAPIFGLLNDSCLLSTLLIPTSSPQHGFHIHMTGGPAPILCIEIFLWPFIHTPWSANSKTRLSIVSFIPHWLNRTHSYPHRHDQGSHIDARRSP